MYKNTNELRKNNPEIYAKIVNIFNILHNSDTGFRGLLHAVRKKLSAQEREILNQKTQDSHFRVVLGKIILLKINEFENAEKTGVPFDRTQFENSVIDEVHILLSDTQKYMAEYDVADYDKLKFALSGKNIMKYHFYISCGNAASAFAYVNSVLPDDEKIPSNDLMFVNTTHWRNLHNGMSGHTIPCVRMADGNFYALDPQYYPEKQSVEFITSELKVGNKIYHLLKNKDMIGHPYMITRLTSPDEYREKYANFDRFIVDCSKVPSSRGKVFLESILHYVNPNEMKTVLKKYEDDEYLTPADRKNLILKLGKSGIKKKMQKMFSFLHINQSDK